MPQEHSLTAYIFQERQDPEMARALFRFRREFFVEELGWELPTYAGLEKDQFDTPAATYCALSRDGRIIGGFRAIRCDHPYLGQEVFPQLAADRPYPVHPDCWEISRFGVLHGHRKHGIYLYGAMLQFAALRRIRALVAIVDLGHERLLQVIGIRTRRYGPPIPLGRQHGTPLSIVAGEICLADQSDQTLEYFDNLLEMVEVHDDTLVRRPVRLSA